MTDITPRENLLIALKGGKPEYIPSLLRDMWYAYPAIMKDHEFQLYGQLMEYMERGEEPSEPITCTDCFGIQWVLEATGPFPIPGTELFHDIEDWREKFIIPDTDGYDWDADAQIALAMAEPEKACDLEFFGLFTTLSNAMGPTDALLAMAENPDEVAALFNAICTFYCEVIENFMQRVHVDVLCEIDDVASARGLMISPEMFRDLVKPYIQRMYDTARKMNPDISIKQHCCGYCQDIVDDFVEMGANAWEPAELVNDLDAIRAKYGNKLTLIAAYPNIKLNNDPDLSEEEVRQIIRGSLDKWAKNGAYAFFNFTVGSSALAMERAAIIDDEVEKYGDKSFYRGNETKVPA